jgi:hypothetical protein
VVLVDGSTVVVRVVDVEVTAVVPVGSSVVEVVAALLVVPVSASVVVLEVGLSTVVLAAEVVVDTGVVAAPLSSARPGSPQAARAHEKSVMTNGRAYIDRR